MADDGICCIGVLVVAFVLIFAFALPQIGNIMIFNPTLGIILVVILVVVFFFIVGIGS